MQQSASVLPPLCAQRVLVTGGLGFIGSHLVRRLLSALPEARVHVLDLCTYAASHTALSGFREHRRVRVDLGDIRDGAAVARAVAGCDLVLHLAAETHVPRSFARPDLFHDVNVEGTRTVLERARDAGVARLVPVSTDEVYGATLSAVREDAPFCPTTPYAHSKAAAEEVVAEAAAGGLDVRVVRPTNAVGPGQHPEKLLPRFVDLALRGLPLTVEGDGRQERTFVPVCDVAEAILAVAAAGEPNGIYNIPGRERMTVLDVAALVRERVPRCPGLCFVADRAVNDAAYRIDGSRLRALGFRQRSSVREQLDAMLRLHEHFGRLPHPAPLASAGALLATA